jgi:hypothetical protein
MRAMLVVGACFVCAGIVVISVAGGVLRVAGVLLVIWGLGTGPAALRLRRQEPR